MSLTLIGLGLFDEKDISLRGIEEAENSQTVYIELYTGKWHGDLKNLEKIVGKEIVILKREDLEDDSDKILEEAKTKNISIFVEGDPLIATTHSTLLTDARKLGVKTKVLHNSSIISAIGETGLHIYKFGPTVTIPFPEKTKGRLPESIFETIRENKKRGLHTLCLLDIAAEENKYMSVSEGLDILSGGKVVRNDDKVVIFSKAGSNNTMLIFGDMDKILKQNIRETPSVIIIPGKLHFTESEYLNNYA